MIDVLMTVAVVLALGCVVLVVFDPERSELRQREIAFRWWFVVNWKGDTGG